MSEGALGCVGCCVFLMISAALYIAIGLATAWLIEWAWNLIVPALFHGPHIDFAIAYAIYIALSLIGGALSIPSKG